MYYHCSVKSKWDSDEMEEVLWASHALASQIDTMQPREVLAQDLESRNKRASP